jgi:acetyl-CoA carboxylase biotin carboxyl carrier protein
VSLTPEDIRALVTAFESSDWDEMSLQYGDTRLDLSRSGRPPAAAAPAAVSAVPSAAAAPAAIAPAAAPPAPAPVAAPASAPTTPAASAAIPEGHRVTSPSLGLFWRSPQPGAPAFVEIGQRVAAEDTVCIVEVMKLMNHVKAGVAGTVVAIQPENGGMVEFGATLVVIDPEG